VTDVETALREGAGRALGRPLSEPETDQLIKYLNLLIKWQRSQRLVGSSEPRWLVDNVLVDSLLFVRALPDRITSLCDVGSGAGVPGIPLKIVMRETDVALIEARQKRASFLSAAVREIPLPRCRVINRRLEDVRSELAGQFEAVVMRCAGDPVGLVDEVGSLLAPRGVIVASGPPAATELKVGEWTQVEGRRLWRYQMP
jgi:16S rRNA (guanine527-N7)-methyltransferase